MKNHYPKMAASCFSTYSSLASQSSSPKTRLPTSHHFSGLLRSPSHALFQRQIDSHLQISSTRRPCRAVVSMAGSGKGPEFATIVNSVTSKRVSA